MYTKTLVSRIGLAVLVSMPVFAQMRLAEVRGVRIEPADLERVQYWATPLYWQPGTTQSGDRTQRAEVLGAQALPPGSALGAPTVFVAVTPCRLMDTRVGQGFYGAFGPPSMAANMARMIPVATSTCGIPVGAAYSIYVTVVPAQGAVVGYVKAWPDDQPEPNMAVLTDTMASASSGNSAIVPAGADGGINVLTQLPTDLVIDTNGYFVLPGSLPLGGTAAAPALTFGDPKTGIYSTGAGSVSIATNGVNALTVGPTGNVSVGNTVLNGTGTNASSKSVMFGNGSWWTTGVAYLRPVTSNVNASYGIALDLMPNGDPKNTWMDICSTDIVANPSNFECLDLYKFANGHAAVKASAMGTGVIRKLTLNEDGGFVGVNTSDPAYQFEVNGTMRAPRAIYGSGATDTGLYTLNVIALRSGSEAVGIRLKNAAVTDGTGSAIAWTNTSGDAVNVKISGVQGGQIANSDMLQFWTQNASFLTQKVTIPGDGGLQINTLAQPACDATHAGTLFYAQGNATTKDAVTVCAHNASNVYAWRVIY